MHQLIMLYIEATSVVVFLVYLAMSLYAKQAPGISFSSRCLVDAIVTIPKTYARGLMLCPTSGDFATLRN